MNRRDYLNGGARLTAKRGTELPHAKLTEAQTIEIRALHAAKQLAIETLNREFSSAGLAKKYGVHYRTIERVLQRTGWVHTLKEAPVSTPN